MAPPDKQWQREVETALFVLANEQMNRSGGKPPLLAILRRFGPDQPETTEARPGSGQTGKKAVPV
jgi:hypothetical protein